MKTLLVDGTSVLVRACRAVRSRRLPPEDQAAVFLGSLLRVIRDEQPDRLVVCWDSTDAGGLWRRDIYPEYKGKRGRSQSADPVRDIASDVLSLMKVPEDVFPRCEADDVIAAYWIDSRRSGDTVIVTGDRDLLQLIRADPLSGFSATVRLIQGAARDELWDIQRVVSELECVPWHLPFISALAGDSSDHIPGIRGIGQVKARKIIGDNFSGNFHDLMLSEDDISSAYRWRSLADLMSPEALIQHKPVTAPVFQPVSDALTRDGVILLNRLRSHGMTRLADSFKAGTLWSRSG